MADILHDDEALGAFWSAYQGGLVHFARYSPNDGTHYSGSWLTQESLRDALGRPAEGDWADWDSVTFDGQSLKLSRAPARGVHQYLEFDLSIPDPWEDVAAIACYGAHYGFLWGSSCEEIAVSSLEFPRSEVLKEILCRGWTESVGLVAHGDPTDDGTNWSVGDESRFLRAAELARRCQEAIDDRGLAFEVWELADLIGQKLNKEAAIVHD